MSFLPRFLDQLKQRGLVIEGPRPGEPDDTLHLVGPAAERTPRLMNSLKVFKPHLVSLYGRQPALPDVPTDARPDAIVGAVETRGESYGQR